MDQDQAPQILREPGLKLVEGCIRAWEKWSQLDLLSWQDHDPDDLNSKHVDQNFDKLETLMLQIAAALEDSARNSRAWFRLGKEICDLERIHEPYRPVPTIPVIGPPSERHPPTFRAPPPPTWKWTNRDLVESLVEQVETSIAELYPDLPDECAILKNLPYSPDHFQPWFRLELGLQGMFLAAFGAATNALEDSRTDVSERKALDQPKQDWFPTAFQEAILKALKGRAMRSDDLGNAVRDRRKLFRRGKTPGALTELLKRGLVKHHENVGYYSAEFPPPNFFPGSSPK